MTRRAQSSPGTDLGRRLDDYAAAARASGSQRWRRALLRRSAYAAAAGSSLAFTTAADAGIMYSGPLNARITLLTGVGPSTVGLKPKTSAQIPGLGAKMKLSFKQFSTFSGQIERFGAARVVGGSKFQFLNKSGFNLSFLFRSGTVPGKGSGAFRSSGVLKERHSFPFATNKMVRTYGNFSKGKTGFAGFRIRTGSLSGMPLYNYGWIRLRWDDFLVAYKDFPQILTVIDWAYNTTSNAPIHIGDTGVPEPSTLVLALMAAGAAGVQAWRRCLASRGRIEPGGSPSAT
jgi:hypothetical protein